MPTYSHSKVTKRSIQLLNYCKANAKDFLTGNPIEIMRYGVNADNKVTFFSVRTERGHEDLFVNGGNCLADCLDNSTQVINIIQSIK